jgi:hypothetical protein
MKTDAEVLLYMRERHKGTKQQVAAARAGMSERTARRYEKAGKLPSQLKRPRTWRTRENPFEDDWRLSWWNNCSAIQRCKGQPCLHCCAPSIPENIVRRRCARCNDRSLPGKPLPGRRKRCTLSRCIRLERARNPTLLTWRSSTSPSLGKRFRCAGSFEYPFQNKQGKSWWKTLPKMWIRRERSE